MQIRPRMHVLALALLLSVQAQAQVFSFTGQGLVAPTGAPDPGGNVPLAVFDTSYSFQGLAGSWTLSASLLYNLGSGTGSGSFSFSQGADSLSGSLSAQAAPVALGPGFLLSYTVTAGSGSWTGASGGGDSLVRLLGDAGSPPTPYLEAGIMAVVPEPSSWLLFAGGGLALLLARRRQRD